MVPLTAPARGLDFSPNVWYYTNITARKVELVMYLNNKEQNIPMNPNKMEPKHGHMEPPTKPPMMDPNKMNPPQK